MSTGDLSRLRAARLQARRRVDFHEETIERLTRELAAANEGLAAAQESLDECERRIKAATTPVVPKMERNG